MPADGPIVIATFPHSMQAEMARELLERNGIEAILRDAGFLGVYPWLSSALGGVKLVVSAEDSRRARDLLGLAGLTVSFPRIVDDG